MNSSHDRLIAALADDLTPVRPLPAPPFRALSWLALVAGVAAALAMFADVPAMWLRLTGMPDMMVATAGAIMTAVSAAFAAFQSSVPDRSRAWALLPLPPAAVWIAASALGCLRGIPLPGTHVATDDEMYVCLTFVVGLSLPLVAVLILMLRRACCLAPAVTAAMAGLASASAAAALLNFFHPYEAAVADLVVHACAVAIVVWASRALGGASLDINFAGRATSRSYGTNSRQ